MKTNAEIENFVASLDYCSTDEIKEFIDEIKNPVEGDSQYTVLKNVENMLLECMNDVKESSGWDDRDIRKLTSLTEAAKAIACIEETLSWQ
jgi:cob(I)alamin adenosyltransferase